MTVNVRWLRPPQTSTPHRRRVVRFTAAAVGALVETDMPFLVSNRPIPTYAQLPQLQK